jgi:hypothetical protein
MAPCIPLVGRESQTASLSGECRALQNTLSLLTNQKQPEVLKFQKIQARTAPNTGKVNWGNGETWPRSIDSLFGMKNNESPSTGSRPGTTIQIVQSKPKKAIRNPRFFLRLAIPLRAYVFFSGRNSQPFVGELSTEIYSLLYFSLWNFLQR